MLDNIDKYITEGLSIHNVPKRFSPHIQPVYPPNNILIFEEWFAENYVGCETDRVYLPIFPTSYHVNNGYGSNVKDLQDYCDALPGKKYFSISQYDDGFLVDWKGKDVLEFNMSKTNGVMIPLICMSHPYKFKSPKKHFANFIGSRTHPIRETAEQLKSIPGYFISFDHHSIENYCRIIHESIFTLCYRGYGLNSFRIAESVQLGSIPVYISDEFIKPIWMDFQKFGVYIHESDIYRIDEILQSIEPEEIISKQNNLQEAYNSHFSYEGAMFNIIKYLETEYNLGE